MNMINVIGKATLVHTKKESQHRVFHPKLCSASQAIQSLVTKVTLKVPADCGFVTFTSHGSWLKCIVTFGQGWSIALGMALGMVNGCGTASSVHLYNFNWTNICDLPLQKLRRKWPAVCRSWSFWGKKIRPVGVNKQLQVTPDMDRSGKYHLCTGNPGFTKY